MYFISNEVAKIMIVIMLCILIAWVGAGYYIGGIKGAVIALLIPVGYYGYNKFMSERTARISIEEQAKIAEINALISARPLELFASGMIIQARQRGIQNFDIAMHHPNTDERNSIIRSIYENSYVTRIEELKRQIDGWWNSRAFETQENIPKILELNDELILLKEESSAFLKASETQKITF